MPEKQQKKEEQVLQQRYMEYQMIQQQLKQVQQQLQQFDQQMAELETINQALKDIENTKAGTELLVPITSGIFVKADLKDSKELLVNVGANTVVSKTVPESMELIKHQIIEINKYREQMLEALQQLSVQAEMIEKELMKITGEQ